MPTPYLIVNHSTKECTESILSNDKRNPLTAPTQVGRLARVLFVTETWQDSIETRPRSSHPSRIRLRKTYPLRLATILQNLTRQGDDFPSILVYNACTFNGNRSGERGTDDGQNPARRKRCDHH